ncbi:Hypothetical predicted protein [Pelobates cultripes]|uniref:Uncharacterized protein n=1 Tax=Pelobates cultripes TaxID=61616 RepID=A0AAD1S6H5_PELCU|nr:Hypothetical predicted protein [Pelobates cultripes]
MRYYVAQEVASWIHPVTRRRHYGVPLQAFQVAVHPRKHRQARRRETGRTDLGTHTHFYTCGKETARQPQSPSDIPEHSTSYQQATMWQPGAGVEHHAAARETTKLHQAGDGPATEESKLVDKTVSTTSMRGQLTLD